MQLVFSMHDVERPEYWWRTANKLEQQQNNNSNESQWAVKAGSTNIKGALTWRYSKSDPIISMNDQLIFSAFR